MFAFARILGIASLLFAIAACSNADSLGDQPPVSYQIQGSPSWENGIGALIGTKCAYCHSDPKPPEAPNNIVADLDLSRYETGFVNGDQAMRGGDALGRWIYEGILDHEVTIFANTSKPRKMPLDYGTPLSAQEKGYLLAWSAAGSPKGNEIQVEGDPIAGRANYYIYCGSCHGSGQGLQDEETQEYLGPAFREEAVTFNKVRSMWLSKVGAPVPTDQELIHLRAFILTLN